MGSALAAGAGGAEAGAQPGFGANTVPIQAEQGPGMQATLTESMPIQLQGTLDPFAWTEFAQKVNAQLGKEHAAVQAMASKVKPLQCIGCLLFVLPYLINMVGMVTGIGPVIPNGISYIPFVFGGVIAGVVVLNVAGCMMARRLTEVQAEAVPAYANISQEFRSRNPNVSLDVRSVQVVVGYRKGRPIHNTVRYVEFAIAGSGAGAGMMQPGMMPPGMMPGMMPPGMMQPGMMQPGMMQPGMQQPGMMQMGANPLLGGPPAFQGAMDFNALQQQGMMNQPGQFGMTQPGNPSGY